MQERETLAWRRPARALDRVGTPGCTKTVPKGNRTQTDSSAHQRITSAGARRNRKLSKEERRRRVGCTGAASFNGDSGISPRWDIRLLAMMNRTDASLDYLNIETRGTLIISTGRAKPLINCSTLPRMVSPLTSGITPRPNQRTFRTAPTESRTRTPSNRLMN